MIRSDFHHSDLYLLTNVNRGVLQGTQRVAPVGWQRFGEFMLAAFRCSTGVMSTPPADAWVRSTDAYADDSVSH